MEHFIIREHEVYIQTWSITKSQQGFEQEFHQWEALSVNALID
jgi:hypothetical protein